MVKLSIIIPVFNVEKYIEKCLQSVFAQDVSSDEYEVIVVDDGTLDNSMVIVEDFAKEQSNLKIIRQSNQGLSAARNTGLNNALGEYIWFIDSDDWVEGNCLKEIFSLLNTYQAQVFVTPLKSINEINNEIKTNFFIGCKSIRFCSGIDFLKAGINTAPVQLYIFDRFFLQKYNLEFMYGVFHEDLEFVPRMLYFTKQVCIINKSFYNYLIRVNGSITSEFSLKRCYDLILIINSLNEFVKTKKLNQIEKYTIKKSKLGCFYSMLSNLDKTNDCNEKNKFILKHFWLIKKLSIESIFSFYPRFTFYGLLLFIDYRFLNFYFKYKLKWS